MHNYRFLDHQICCFIAIGNPPLQSTIHYGYIFMTKQLQNQFKITVKKSHPSDEGILNNILHSTYENCALSSLTNDVSLKQTRSLRK